MVFRAQSTTKDSIRANTKRIHYKLCYLCFSVIDGKGPEYLSELLIIYTHSRQLRSTSDTRLFRIPSFKTNRQRSFFISSRYNLEQPPSTVRHSAPISPLKSSLEHTCSIRTQKTSRILCSPALDHRCLSFFFFLFLFSFFFFSCRGFFFFFFLTSKACISRITASQRDRSYRHPEPGQDVGLYSEERRSQSLEPPQEPR